MDDPVHEHTTDPAHEWGEGLGWFFYDETGAIESGPFDTREAAQASLDEYVKEVLA